MGQSWQLLTSSLSWRAWAGEIVVYNHESGDTHHLDPLAAEVFESLLEGSTDLGELEERVARSLAVEKTQELRDTLSAIVTRFETTGLVAQA
jgi:PqqD family protein of HPr-rel-A system